MIISMNGMLLIIGAVVADVAANVFLKKSAGFTYKKYSITAILFIGVAFLCLANAIQVMELSIAYAMFGAFSLLLTTTIDRLFFGLRIKLLGMCGVMTMIMGIVLIKLV